MSVDKFGNFSVDKKRLENIKNGTKPLDNNDLATKQYTDEILGKLGEDL